MFTERKLPTSLDLPPLISGSLHLDERQDSETPPSQQAPVNIMYNSSSSPTTNLGGTNPMVPHYYQPAPLPLPPPAQHNVLFPHHIPPAGSNGLYPMQP